MTNMRVLPPLLRTQSRHGAEPVDDGLGHPVYQPNGRSFFRSLSGGIAVIAHSCFPHLLAACLFTIYITGRILQGQVKMNLSVIVALGMLNVLPVAVYLNYTDSFWGLVFILLLVVFIHSHLKKPYLPVDNKAVLITGCDRGMGHAAALHFDALGFRVFAGCLDKTCAGAEELERKCSDRLTILQLDVCRDEDVFLAAERVQTSLGDNKLWGIINNAGICLAGNTEIMAIDDMRRVMEVNYWGPVRVCKAFLPLVRRARGRVVNVASNAGLAPIPLMGAYCASKAGLSSLTEVLREELRPWGVQVSAIIPSGFNTGILAYDKSKMADKWFKAASEIVKEDFGKESFHVTPKSEGKEDTLLSSNLSLIVDVMLDALLSPSPKSYYHRGFLARSLPFLYTHLPTVIGQPAMKILGDWFVNVTPKALKTGF